MCVSLSQFKYISTSCATRQKCLLVFVSMVIKRGTLHGIKLGMIKKLLVEPSLFFRLPPLHNVACFSSFVAMHCAVYHV